ncbi:hypothetical protein [Stenotrophomonas sp. 3diitr2024]|uniref:hypothetical protein n=1 Tax=Stenotrophomonas sp. 3diitr2024 TaxID=3345115 RepID=UPI0035C9DAD2
MAGGLTLGGKWVMGDSDSLHYQLTGGEGIARYIGLVWLISPLFRPPPHDLPPA